MNGDIEKMPDGYFITLADMDHAIRETTRSSGHAMSVLKTHAQIFLYCLITGRNDSGSFGQTFSKYYDSNSTSRNSRAALLHIMNHASTANFQKGIVGSLTGYSKERGALISKLSWADLARKAEIFLLTFCYQGATGIKITNANKQYYPLAHPKFSGMSWRQMQHAISGSASPTTYVDEEEE